jgi:hypothetical protein
MVSRGAKGLMGGISGKIWGKPKEEDKPKEYADEVVVKIF